MKLKIGDKAPDFQLVGSDGKTHHLNDGLNRVTVLLFYVGDNTPTCSRQLTEYNDAYVALEQQGVRLLGIAPQSQESHHAFTCRLDLKFPLLVDEDCAIGKAYGVSSFLGVYKRSTLVVDQSGHIQYLHKAGLVGFVNYNPAQQAVRVATELVAGASSAAS